MGKGISVHVGVNQAQPSFGVHPLLGCHNDAQAMFQIATDRGFEATPPFLDEMATFANVKAAIIDAATRLEAGDIFLFTFAGHGSIRPTSPALEIDSQDETILLHDCILIDNYLRLSLWPEFKEGVRILGIADSCHSGTVLASAPGDIEPAPPSGPTTLIGGGGGQVATAVAVAPAIHRQKELDPMDPPLVSQRIPEIGKHDRAFSEADRVRILAVSPQIHKDMQDELELKPPAPLKAKLLTLGACRDFELARDGETNGVFTKALIDVWNNGEFEGENYTDFILEIAERVKLASPNQHPIRRPIDADEEFVNQRPFTIG